MECLTSFYQVPPPPLKPQQPHFYLFSIFSINWEIHGVWKLQGETIRFRLWRNTGHCCRTQWNSKLIIALIPSYHPAALPLSYGSSISSSVTDEARVTDPPYCWPQRQNKARLHQREHEPSQSFSPLPSPTQCYNSHFYVTID